MPKKYLKSFLIIFLAIFLGYLIGQNLQQLYYLPSGKWVARLKPETPFETKIENIRYKGISGTVSDDLIYLIGQWEPEVLGFLRDAMQKVDKSRGVFLDIGASSGWHSLYMSQYAKNVLAVEPFPPRLERLKDSIQANQIENIDVLPVGFSNQVGVLPFYLESKSFDTEFSRHFNTDKSIQLPLVVGDDYLKASGIKQIDLIKIDIEGYERFALLGLKHILHTHRPVVAMELNTTEGGFNRKEQLTETFPAKYQFFIVRPLNRFWKIDMGPYLYVYGPGIDPDQINQYSLEKFDFDFNRRKHHNLAAVPVEKLPALQAE